MPVTPKPFFPGNARSPWPRPVKLIILIAESLANHRRAHRRGRKRIDQDEASRCSVFFITVKENRPAAMKFHRADLIHFQPICLAFRKRIHVYAEEDSRRAGLHHAARML